MLFTFQTFNFAAMLHLMQGNPGKKFIGFLRLVRFPNVFTSIADIVAGGAIAASIHSGGFSLPRLAALSGASAGMYLAGMAFNDVADREEDGRVRPNRPIPSGQVSLSAAVLCGIALMLIGATAAFSAGISSGYCALILALCVLAYDFAAKGILVLGPATLGLCRFWNVQLGLSSQLDIFANAADLHASLVPALGVGIYAAGLTAFSAQEESGKQLRAILLGWLFCGGAIALALVRASHPTLALIALAPLMLVLLVLTFRLKQSGTPTAARNLVRFGVMGVCVLDAGLILGFADAAYWAYAIASVALLAPGIVIAKWLAQKEA